MTCQIVYHCITIEYWWKHNSRLWLRSSWWCHLFMFVYLHLSTSSVSCHSKIWWTGFVRLPPSGLNMQRYDFSVIWNDMDILLDIYITQMFGCPVKCLADFENCSMCFPCTVYLNGTIWYKFDKERWWTWEESQMVKKTNRIFQLQIEVFAHIILTSSWYWSNMKIE